MARRLKVLISAYACAPRHGSEPEVGWQWALQMSRAHDITVLTRAKNRTAIEGEFARSGKPDNLSFVYLDLDPLLLYLKARFALGRPYYILWQREARKLVRRLTQEHRFDLLHHATFAAFRYPTAVWNHDVPSIWGPIGGIESIPAGLLPWRYPRALASEILRNFDNFLQVATMGVLQTRARSSDLVLVSTREMQETFTALGVSSELMPAIGLHTATIPAPPREPRQGPLRLLYAGNLLPLKGLDFALHAMKASGNNAQLTLIGDGPFRNSLAGVTRDLGLESRVEFRGRVPREEMMKCYANFDVFLFPSLHDTGGYAVIEAMCNTMPVICLAVGGPEIAVQPGCGVTIPIGSRRTVVTGLSAAIQFYDANRDRVLNDGREARRSVVANYDWELRRERMNHHYQRTARNL
jgi:glycosyltransferase involved in cell wall biosynthesis